MDWLRVFAKRRAAPRFSVNSMCAKQLFLLRRTQLFSFVELQVFFFVELQLLLFLWTRGVLSNCSYYVELNCSYSSSFNCSNLLWTRSVLINCSGFSVNFNCSHSSNLKCSCSSNLKCSYYIELKHLILRRCILYQESTLGSTLDSALLRNSEIPLLIFIMWLCLPNIPKRVVHIS